MAKKKPTTKLTKPSSSHASRARARSFLASPVHDVIDAICEEIAGGSPQASAAAKHGVSAEALRGRANEDPEIAMKLSRALAMGEAKARRKLEDLIEEGLPTGGQTWLMERLYRGTYNIPTLVQSESRVLVTEVPATSEALRRAAEERARVEALEAEAKARGEGT